MFGIISLAYPVSQVFRFTTFGSEITDRSAAFLFLPVAYVLTILITHFWPTRKLNWKAISLITCTISLVLMGSVITGDGPNWSNLPGPYIVVADAQSIEPEGVQAAKWALAYFGPDNRVATDRINHILIGTYGDQRTVTGLADNVDISPIFFSSQFDPEDIAILRSASVRYLVTDLRLSTAPPLEGFYYDGGEPHQIISRAALTKFDAVSQINRLFDSGNIVIYDVGAFSSG
jgi:hypothetical protein